MAIGHIDLIGLYDSDKPQRNMAMNGQGNMLNLDMFS